MNRIAIGITLALAFALITATGASHSQDEPNPIRWALRTDASTALTAGDRFNAQLTATIDQGWHLYSPDQPPGGPLPTRIRLVEGEPFKLVGEIGVPEPQVTFDPVFNMETQIFEGEATFTLPVAVAADASAGKHTLSVSATFQSCNQTTCLPPKAVKVTFDVNIAARATGMQRATAGTAGAALNFNRTNTGESVQTDAGAGAQVPEFSFTDFENKPRKFSEFHGKYVLVDFWATWCKPCLADIPHLKELYAKYHSRGFEIIGMDSETLGGDDETPDPEFARERQALAKKIVSTRGATWTHATAETAVPVAVKIFAVKKLPTNILIDTQGRIITRVEEGAELDKVLAGIFGPTP